MIKPRTVMITIEAVTDVPLDELKRLVRNAVKAMVAPGRGYEFTTQQVTVSVQQAPKVAKAKQ